MSTDTTEISNTAVYRETKANDTYLGYLTYNLLTRSMSMLDESITKFLIDTHCCLYESESATLEDTENALGERLSKFKQENMDKELYGCNKHVCVECSWPMMTELMFIGRFEDDHESCDVEAFKNNVSSGKIEDTIEYKQWRVRRLRSALLEQWQASQNMESNLTMYTAVARQLEFELGYSDDIPDELKENFEYPESCDSVMGGKNERVAFGWFKSRLDIRVNSATLEKFKEAESSDDKRNLAKTITAAIHRVGKYNQHMRRGCLYEVRSDLFSTSRELRRTYRVIEKMMIWLIEASSALCLLGPKEQPLSGEAKEVLLKAKVE